MFKSTDDLPPPAEKRLVELTDKIVAISLALQPLCNDSTQLSRESRRTVRESCELLRSVSEELVALLRPLTDGETQGESPVPATRASGLDGGPRSP
jgi:hypothetical protein